MKDEINLLERMGLTNAQATIYLTLLNLGSSPVGEIIKRTELASSVVHNNINKLIKLGIINFILIGKVKHYNSIEPEVFKDYITNKKFELDKELILFEKTLPKLKILKNNAKKTSAEIFEGRRGFKTAFLENYQKAKNNSSAQFFPQPKEFQNDEKLHEIFLQLDTIASEKKLRLTGIVPKKSEKIWKTNYENKKTYNIKYSEEEFPWGLMIFEEAVLISIWGDEPITIKINNEQFRKKAKQFFEKKYGKIK